MSLFQSRSSRLLLLGTSLFARSASGLTVRHAAPVPRGLHAASVAAVVPVGRSLLSPTHAAPALLRARTLMCDAAPAAPAEEGPAPYEMLDVRVGQIVEAWEHPDSEKLWCERIDVGEEEPREIASGLRAYYATAEELTGRKVLVVCNLKPAKLGGFPSNGMVLCASSADRSTVEFVVPPEG